MIGKAMMDRADDVKFVGDLCSTTKDDQMRAEEPVRANTTSTRGARLASHAAARIVSQMGARLESKFSAQEVAQFAKIS